MYSQNKEEQIILSYFQHQPGTGTFLDLGAYNGIELSNVRALAEKQWCGVMVEASPTVFKQLKKNYKDFGKIEVRNVAIGCVTGMLTFYDNYHAVGTLHKAEADRWGSTQKFYQVEVHCIEINEFLSTCRYQTFDFISCDIEGEDLNVISRLDFNKLKTKMICVEFNGKDKQLYNNILRPYRFRLIHENAENLIFAR